ncbi:MAG: hypothetical protein AAGJ82_04455 [Bacteroidota bacterium]
MATKTAKKPTAKKTTATKTDFNKKFKNIQTTAKMLNTQIREVAVEAMDVAVENGKEWTNEATTRVKTAFEGVTIENGVNTIKTTAKNINDYSVEVAEDLVEGALATGKSWQGVAEKAIKGGLKLANKQQDIIFEALEDVKGQVVNGAGRVRTLVTKARQN